MKQNLCGSAIVLLALAAALLSGCAGGGAGGDLTASGGIGGSGVTVGSVSKFGSIFVNGVEFDTAGAAIVVDGTERGTGDDAARANLAVGMRVRVEGPFADRTGSATRVVYNEDVVGPVEQVEALDAETLLLTVMGQAVVVDPSTALSGVTREAIAAGQALEVSGPRDEAGRILAAFARKAADAYATGDPVQVRGNAAGVNPGLRTFAIGGLTIDYSLADLNGLAGPDPEEGGLVEVRGALEASGTLLASAVASESVLGATEAEQASVAGVVTRFSSLSSFEVSGVPVITDAATSFLRILPAEIGTGTGLLVTGSLARGRLLADTVQPTAPVKVESDVAAVTGAELSLLGLEGLAVAGNDLTRFVGQARSLEEILPGDHVKVYGAAHAAGRVVAEKIVVQKNPKRQLALRGPVESVDGPVISVLGVAIDTGRIPEDGFSLEGAGPLSRGDFLARLRAGDTVNLNGALTGATASWRTISLSH